MLKERTGHDIEAVVCRRTRMDDLADVLIDEIYAEIRDSGDLFRRVPVIVPNRSIERYLSIRFAHRHEVTAQIRFSPLMSVFSRFMPRNSAGGRLNIDKSTIGWRIYRILQERGSETAFPDLSRWIGGDAKKLYELSCQLGCLYDKYMLYRPEWINAWEAGITPHGLGGEPAAAWQGELWRRVAGTDWKGNHFAAVYDRIGKGEDPGPVSEADRAGTVRIFGFSQLPPAVLRCLERFSCSGMRVKLYHLVPSKYFLGDLRKKKDELKKLKEYLEQCFAEGRDSREIPAYIEDLYFQHNPLMASFAAQSRILLDGTEDWSGDTGYDDEEESPAEEDDTLLSRLQDRIRRDVAPCRIQAASLPEGGGCRSVQIRSCYSAFREVEAAYNFILHCLDEDPALSMKDIFIMSPSPAEYAPLVDAVFNHSHDTVRSGRGTEVRLGVSVADRSQTERLPAYRTMMKVLSLFKGDFAASDVFGILQDPELQAQWGITPGDYQYCLSAAMRAGIRWGWDAGSRGRSGEKAFPENSWQAGFDRMLLNYAMDADPSVPYSVGGGNIVFPVSGFEDGKSELLGKLIGLTSKLHEIAQYMRGLERNGAPFREWESALIHYAGFLFGQESELKKLLQSVLSAWQQTLADADAPDVPLTSEIVLAYLQDKHAMPEDNTIGFMRGRITFCGLRPMRSIPAGAILLLGMDHDAFPEQDDKRDFDIMQLYRDGGKPDSGAGCRPGDPVRRDESRQLFLDTVMAARRYLYISYIGRDIHDRKEKPPSACVEELKSYLAQEFGRNSFVEIQEPIHAFSAELFRRGAVNQSYSTTLLAAANHAVNPACREARPLFDIRGGKSPAEDARADQPCLNVELGELKSFFRNPAEAYLRNGLDARVSLRKAALLEDSEPFENKKDWRLKDGLFQLYRETDAGERDALKHDSLLKMKADGFVTLMQSEDDWADWADIVRLDLGIESIPQNGMETVPAEEVEFCCSAADAGLFAGLAGGEPEGEFRATLALPETKVYLPEPGNEDSDPPCVQIVSSLSKDPSLSGSQLVSPILDHLRANLARKTMTRLVYLGRNKNVSAMVADPMEKADAEKAFRCFLCLYRAGLRRPLPFFPNTSYHFFKTKDEAGAEERWNGYSSKEVEKFGWFFGNELELDDRFRFLAEAFFGSVDFHMVPSKRGRRQT